VQATPASLTTKEETQAEVKAAGPDLPIQWSAGLACAFIALTVIGVVTASRTANKLKAEKA
jgi:formate/nitrite transporter FocA (FNT family)